MRLLNINTIYLFAIPFCLYLILVDGVITDFDTISYSNAWSSFHKGSIDLWRTPIYPFILESLRLCFGENNYMFATIIIQFATFLISIRYFYNISASLVNNEQICFWITAFYALFPCIPTWNNFILTESFAVYGTIFFLYYIIKIYKDGIISYHIHLTVCLLFLVFLRPSFIFIIPVLFLLLCFLWYTNKSLKKSVYVGGITLCFVGFSLISYMHLYKKEYGLYTPTAVGVLNNYYIARMEGMISPEMTNDSILKKYIMNSIKKHGIQYSHGSGYDLGIEGIHAIKQFGPHTVSNLVSSSGFNHPSQKMKRFIKHFRKAANDKLFSTYNTKWNTLTDLLCVRLNILYIILFIYIITFMHHILKKREIVWFSLLLFLLGAGHLFVILYSCQNVWYRLIIPFTPVYLLMIGQLLNLLKVKKANIQYFYIICIMGSF